MVILGTAVLFSLNFKVFKYLLTGIFYIFVNEHCYKVKNSVFNLKPYCTRSEILIMDPDPANKSRSDGIRIGIRHTAFRDDKKVHVPYLFLAAN